MRILILLLLLNLLCENVVSQQTSESKIRAKDTLSTGKISARDTLPPAEKYGLRAGVDISKLLRSGIDDLYTGIEFAADYRIYKEFFLASEFGNENITKELDNISATSKGSYFKLGADYNAYDNWYGMQNNIIVGVRYGIGTAKQQLNSYSITQDSNGQAVFPEDIRTERSDGMPFEESEALTSQWIELLFGLKAEIARSNIYMGFHISLKRMISKRQPEQFDSLFVPGFGLTNDFSDIGVGYNYTITYLIPFFKKKK